MAFFKIVNRCQEQNYKAFYSFFFSMLMIDFLFKTAEKFSILLSMHLFIFLETSTIPILYVISVKSVQFKGILKLSFIMNCLSLAERDPCLSTLCNVNTFSPRKLIPELKVKQMGILKGKVITLQTQISSFGTKVVQFSLAVLQFLSV